MIFECAFINWWMIEENTPEVVTGWNSELYDIPYLVRSVLIEFWVRS
jgi:DNA polymerase elongation subunit (family B)